MNLAHLRSKFFGRCASILILGVFISTVICPPPAAYAQIGGQASLGFLPPASMLAPSAAFSPMVIKGLRVDPQNLLQFNFIVDTGDTGIKGEALKNESTKLIKYFLAALTTPDKEMWVNLSPYEKNRIIPDGLGSTEMGRDLLSQDYLLKQLTASLMYPESELSERFWKTVYAKVKEEYGITELPVNTLNKVWIVPDKALVCEYGETAFVVEKHLKVMLEEEYLKSDTRYVVSGTKKKERSTYHVSLTTEIIKQILIPAIEKEVNEGKNFSQLRQIYNSMILATWYKRRLKESLLGQLYVDKNKTKGIDLKDKEAKYKIYDQYLEAFNKGAYDYIKEDYDPVAQEVVTRKYVSGGMAYDSATVAIVTPEKLDRAQLAEMSAVDGKTYGVEGFYVENRANGNNAVADAATLAEDEKNIARSLQIIQNAAFNIEKVLTQPDIQQWLADIKTWMNETGLPRLDEISKMQNIEEQTKAYVDLSNDMMKALWNETSRQYPEQLFAAATNYAFSLSNESFYNQPIGQVNPNGVVYDLTTKLREFTLIIKENLVLIDGNKEQPSIKKENIEGEFHRINEQFQRIDAYIKLLHDIQNPLNRTFLQEEIGLDSEDFPEHAYKNFLIPLQQNHADLLKLARRGKEVKSLSGEIDHELGNVINRIMGRLEMVAEPLDGPQNTALMNIFKEYSASGLGDLWTKLTQAESHSDVDVAIAFDSFRDGVKEWSQRVSQELDPDNSDGQEILRLLNFFTLFLSRNFDKEMSYQASTFLTLIDDAVFLLKYYSRSNKGLVSVNNQKIRLIKELESSIENQNVDKLRLLQVFMNLFKNAIEAMPEGGTLTVKTEAVGDGQNFRIIITDTGKGIAPEDLGKIFDKGFTTKESRGGEGKGIGAALNKQYIEAMGGTIKVESEVGKGSTFTIELPIRRTAPENTAGDAAMTAQEHSKLFNDVYSAVMGLDENIRVTVIDNMLKTIEKEESLTKIFSPAQKRGLSLWRGTHYKTSVEPAFDAVVAIARAITPGISGLRVVADFQLGFGDLTYQGIGLSYDNNNLNTPDNLSRLRDQVQQALLSVQESLTGEGAVGDNRSRLVRPQQQAETAPGGIDFNSELLDLQIKRDGNGVPLPLLQQPIENMRIDGFFPVITTITPIRNVPGLLGMLGKEN